VTDTAEKDFELDIARTRLSAFEDKRLQRGRLVEGGEGFGLGHGGPFKGEPKGGTTVKTPLAKERGWGGAWQAQRV
jgi:hypothetical protein